MTEIALFGGGGFIGSHMCRRFAENGHELDVVDIASDKIDDIVDHESVTFHELNIRDDETKPICRQITDDNDIVVDLIAYANPQQYVDDPIDVVKLNYDTNMDVVEDCVETDTRLIQFSTCEVYGKLGDRTGDDIVFSEDTSDLILGPVPSHRWIYASAKELLERMVHAHGMEHDLDWTIVRPFNFIGRDMDYIIQSEDEGTPRVFASFMSALLYDHTMYLVNGGTHRRAFTYIDDAVDAMEIIIANEDEQFSQEILNIGNPDNEYSIRELAELMRDLYVELVPGASLPPMEEISGEEFYGDGYEDSERRVPDIEKLRAGGWEPQWDLESALRETMQYYIDEHEQAATVNPD